jgi:hypothetical protein
MDDAVESRGDAAYWIEAIQDCEADPDPGKQGQDDLFGPDGENDGEYGRQSGLPARVSHEVLVLLVIELRL